MTNTLKKGDAVVMHTCIEAEGHNGQVWICRSDEFTACSGTSVIFLEGYSGYFATEFLQKVNISKLLKENKEQNFEIEELNRYIEQQKIQEKILLERLKKAEGSYV